MEKNKLFSGIILLLAMLVMYISPALALDEIVYSPFTDSGSWGTSSTGGSDTSYGRNRAFDYDDILYVANGDKIYSYNMLTWEYLGSETFDDTIYDLQQFDDTVYLTQGETIKKYNIADFSLISTYNYSDIVGANIASFDVMSDESNLAYSSGEGFIQIRLMSNDSFVRNLSKTADVVRFSYDDEVVMGADVAQWGVGVQAYAVSNGASIFTDNIAENYLVYFSMHPTEDRYIMGWRYAASTTSNGMYERNFSSNSVVAIRSSVGTNQPYRASYSVDGTLTMKMRSHVGYDPYNILYLSMTDDASSLGTWDPGDDVYGLWTYIPYDNKYAVVGGSNALYVLNTGVAQPLITTIAVDNDGVTSIYSGAIVDIGDATWANCSIQYKNNETDVWSESDIFGYTNASDFPSTYDFTTYSTIIGESYDYRAKCDYETTLGGVGIAYGQELTFTSVRAPFNPFDAILENLGLVVGMFLTIVLVVILTRYGLTNPLIILALVVAISFIMTIIGLYSLTTTIFITIFCAVIGFYLNVTGGNQ